MNFFTDNKDVIMQSLTELADNLGEEVFAMIANFNCLKGSNLTSFEIAQALYEHGECETIVKNALAWYALEEVANSMQCEFN